MSRITPEWCAKMAELEGDQEIGAGALAADPFNPLPPSLLDRMAEALRRYGQHRPSCNAARALPFELRSGAVKCTCGFSEALAEYDAAKEGT